MASDLSSAELAYRKEIRRLKRELEKERRVNQDLAGVRKSKAAVHKVRAFKGKGSKPPVVSVALASDLHIDEIVDPGKVNHRNEHSPDIAEEKLDAYWNHVVRLVEKEQAQAQINRHVQWLGGDFFSGHIHEDLIESTAFTPLESMLWLIPRLKAGLKYLRDNLDVPEIIIVWSFGNHGRDGKRPRVSTAAEHNYEWLLGHIIKGEIENEGWGESFRFIVESGYHTYLDIGGYTIRFHHGDWIRFAGGRGGLSLPMRNAQDGWNSFMHADLDVMGHWHQSIDMPHFVCNGSLVGYNPYSIKIKCPFELPQQGFFLVDLERRMKTGYFPVHVTKRP